MATKFGLVKPLTRTKIVCTLGPASSSEEALTTLIQSGLDVCRLNFSHGEHEVHQELFNRVRSIGDKLQQQVSILCDIQGPKIRTGEMAEPFDVVAGDKIKVTPEEVVGTPEVITVRYENILNDLDVDDVIFINDGIIKLVVESKDDQYLNCVVACAGTISSRKGCNIPSGNLSIDVVTPKDDVDLEFIAKLNPEWVAASFVGTAEDVQIVRDYLKKYGNDDIKIISKIERPIALTYLEAIVEASDGIMVARGDLGVEIDTWDVPIWQKEMCRLCNIKGIPCIVATQMLESMTGCPRPTRAEAGDVFNAVIDGADAVMLSAESSVGQYPVEAVTIMNRIAQTAQDHIAPRDPADFTTDDVTLEETVGSSVYHAASLLTKQGKNAKIVVVTGPPNGNAVQQVTKFRPPVDIISITSDLQTAREMNLQWGTLSVLSETIDNFDTVEGKFAAAVEELTAKGLLEDSTHVILVESATFTVKEL
eukprot:TRINITY_DN9791_c0_g1_i1.p1 TRINITY_DN9791_c0_g1~~TRINITY_DN9791_c0_g1_i1.p1  ORF type:complete len:479 (-),score=140.62 TRINITY_DN9791_c0_g1_i1:39-1475(-)